ncbi:Protein ABSCISIC ACID-INSENSITIVE 5 [Linum grandiflorum]
MIGNPYGMDMGMGGHRGRKRVIDGSVEKVVERRQRRMIKNRESAARSRARKQAYTVELEAELNQLKEENSQLKQALVELQRKRKQQVECRGSPNKGTVQGAQGEGESEADDKELELSNVIDSKNDTQRKLEHQWLLLQEGSRIYRISLTFNFNCIIGGNVITQQLCKV